MKGRQPVRTTEHPASDAVRCFVLTDIRVVEDQPRSVVIDSLAGRDLTATMEQPPLPGALVQLDLGDLGWVDAVVRWTAGTQVGVELQRDIATDALLAQERQQLRGAPQEGTR